MWTSAISRGHTGLVMVGNISDSNATYKEGTVLVEAGVLMSKPTGGLQSQFMPLSR